MRAGTFNNWERIRMNPSTKDFSTLVNLNEGDYEYKFLVDGQWVNDPTSTDVVTTSDGHKWVPDLQAPNQSH